MALLENGTHVLWAAHVDKYATDELTLAEKVIPSLGKGMLCLADRFFPSYKLWRLAAKTGADLLWRTRQNARLDVEKRLPDGSYLSRIYASTSDRRKRRNGIMVRVIDYRLEDVEGVRDRPHQGSGGRCLALARMTSGITTPKRSATKPSAARTFPSTQKVTDPHRRPLLTAPS